MDAPSSSDPVVSRRVYRSGVSPALSFLLSAVMIFIYLGFIVLVAFKKTFLGSTLVPGLSWGILLGALVIVSAWLLTLVYVLLANRRPPTD